MTADPVRNLYRDYRLSIEPTLFGEWSCVREWGRIGSPGQVQIGVIRATPRRRPCWTANSVLRNAVGMPGCGRRHILGQVRAFMWSGLRL